MTEFKDGRRLRIFIDDGQDAQGRPRYEAIVDLLRTHGVSGASVFRGIAGYGVHGTVHRAKLFGSHADMPVLIEAIDTQERTDAVLAELQGLVGEGLILTEAVRFARYSDAPP